LSRERAGDGFAPPLPDDEPTEDMNEKQEAEQEQETPEEKQARVLKAHSDAIQKWEADTHDRAEQQAIVDHIAQTGELPEGAKLEPSQVDAIYDGYVQHISNNILADVGLDFETWMNHVDESEHPVLMGLALKGDWATIHHHAARVKDQMRRRPELYL